MTTMQQLEIISKETIVPSSPTPPHLRIYNLSLLDQLTTSIYIPMILFYKNKINPPKLVAVNRSRWLKHSLSETLTKYYPFAGRLTNNISIDCNDDGVDFWEAQINCQLDEVLKKADVGKTLNIFFPRDFLWKDTCEGSLIGIQVNYFDCGGVAISLCISHKIADGCTISTFLRDWATHAAQSGEHVSPEFITTCIPEPKSINHFIVPKIELEKRNCVTKRFVFEGSKIAQLKAMVADSGLQNSTKVQVVIAFLYKCAIVASNFKLASFRDSLLIQMVNMRPKMDPPLSRNSAGNFTWYLTISAKERDVKLHELVGQLRNGIIELCDKEKNNMDVNEWLLEVVESTKEVKMLFDDLNVYRCSSFCRFSLYQVDFGMGNPLWVTMADGMVKNVFVLMDTEKGDGIEALVTLEEEDMVIFQSDKELLAFAYMSPVYTLP